MQRTHFTAGYTLYNCVCDNSSILHLSGNTSGVLKSSSDWLNYTGFPGDVCVAFFSVPPGNKDAVTPSRKKKAVVFTTVTTDEMLEFQKYVKYLKLVALNR